MHIPYTLLSIAASAAMLFSACHNAHEGHDHDHEGDEHTEASDHKHAPDEIEFTTEQARVRACKSQRYNLPIFPKSLK